MYTVPSGGCSRELPEPHTRSPPPVAILCPQPRGTSPWDTEYATTTDTPREVYIDKLLPHPSPRLLHNPGLIVALRRRPGPQSWLGGCLSSPMLG